jgi:hypothetical protein
MSQFSTFVAGVAAGAAAMYLGDPDRGRARRARTRDRLIHAQHAAQMGLGRAVRDLEHRASGLRAELGASMWGEREVSDDKLAARVRAQLGRLVSHPHALQVEARHGVVRLSGPVLSTEVIPLIRRVRAIRGVHGVENALDVREWPDVPALRSGPTTPVTHAPPSPARRLARTPAGRLVAIVAGTGLGAAALRRGGLAGAAISALALGAAGRALSELSSARG